MEVLALKIDLFMRAIAIRLVGRSTAAAKCGYLTLARLAAIRVLYGDIAIHEQRPVRHYFGNGFRGCSVLLYLISIQEKAQCAGRAFIYLLNDLLGSCRVRRNPRACSRMKNLWQARIGLPADFRMDAQRRLPDNGYLAICVVLGNIVHEQNV